MRTTSKITKQLFLILLFLTVSFSLVYAQEEDTETEESYITVNGVVKDKQTKKKIEFANISVPGTNIGTITNSDGEFTIKIKKSVTAKDIQISHIGYLNTLIPVNGRDLSNLTAWMDPSYNLLQEIIVRPRSPRDIIEEAMKKVPVNYSNQNNLLTGFYRETAQKGRRYINISEAVIDLYKTPYSDMNIDRDRVQIYKGRKLLSQRSNDTLIVKLLGGPNLSIYVDIVKNPDILLDRDMLSCYAYKMEESVMLDDRPHYVIRFTPMAILPFALYEGKLFIDKERLSFSRAEFNLDMSDHNKATQAILKKKPFGLRFRPQEITYLVTYKEQDGLTYLSYIRNMVRFRCDWKRKLFATNYTITSEMVVTDGKETNTGISNKVAFKQTQSLSDNVNDFYDEDFWGSYNIIEPTESLESAVNKLKKQQN